MVQCLGQMAISKPIPESREFEYWRKTIQELGGDLVGVQSPMAFDADAELQCNFYT